MFAITIRHLRNKILSPISKLGSIDDEVYKKAGRLMNVLKLQLLMHKKLF